VKVDWSHVAGFPPGTQLAGVAAGKDCTFVRTSAGALYHWCAHTKNNNNNVPHTGYSGIYSGLFRIMSVKKQKE
jgi:membrane associated rhomboid family serine protease